MRIHVNERWWQVPDDGRDDSLLEVLRHDLGLTGAKGPCGGQRCGACLVLVDDIATRACELAVAHLGTRRVTTVEQLARAQDGEVGKFRQALIRRQATQCGYCLPAQFVAATALLRRDTCPRPNEIRAAMSQVLCRCGSYQRVVAALREVLA